MWTVHSPRVDNGLHCHMKNKFYKQLCGNNRDAPDLHESLAKHPVVAILKQPILKKNNDLMNPDYSITTNVFTTAQKSRVVLAKQKLKVFLFDFMTFKTNQQLYECISGQFCATHNNSNEICPDLKASLLQRDTSTIIAVESDTSLDTRGEATSICGQVFSEHHSSFFNRVQTLLDSGSKYVSL